MEKTFTEAEKRVLKIAEYILDTKCTHRQAGEHFGVTGSYVTSLMKHKLPVIDPDIAEEVSKIGKSHNIDKGVMKEVHDQHMPRLEEGAPSKTTFTYGNKKTTVSMAKPPESILDLIGSITKPSSVKSTGLNGIAVDAFDNLILYLGIIRDKIATGAPLTKDETDLALETMFAKYQGYKLKGLRYEEQQG